MGKRKKLHRKRKRSKRKEKGKDRLHKPFLFLKHKGDLILFLFLLPLSKKNIGGVNEKYTPVSSES